MAVYQSGSNYSQEDFNTVRQQILTEVQYVGDIIALYKNINNLYTAIQTEGIPTLGLAYDRVNTALNPPSKATANSRWKAVLAGAQTIAGDVASLAGGPPAKLALDLVFVSGNIAAAFANDPTGNALQNAAYEFDQLKAGVVDEFGKHLTVIGNLFGLILSDWGRLQALGVPLSVGQIKWDTSLTGMVTGSITRQLQRNYLIQLIDASFEFGTWTNMGAGSPPPLKTLCDHYTWQYISTGPTNEIKECYTPDSHSENWIAVPRGPSANSIGDGQNYDIHLFGTDVRCSAEKNSSLLAPLFAHLNPSDSPSQTAGLYSLGLYKPYFFLYTDAHAHTRVNAKCPGQ